MESNNNSYIFDSFVVSKYLDEEIEFFQEEELKWENFGKNKWLWLLDHDENISEVMVNKYFESVLLPFYLIKKDLSRNHLKKLGFNPFLIRISHNNYHLRSKLY